MIWLMASESSASGGSIALSLVAAALLILANGVFVAYEFALIAAKRSSFESAAERGVRSARLTVRAFSDLSTQLAGAQLGITMASLGLGYVGEPAVAHIIEALLGTVVSEEVGRVIGFTVGLGFVVFLHLVIGEMVPKNVAIAAPDATMRFLVLPYQGYLAVVRPAVKLLNSLANLGCRALGVTPRDELVSAHSAAELAAIVAASSEGGAIEAESAGLLSGALDFSQRPVSDVATPLSELATIRDGATAAQVEQVVRRTGQTRLPILSSARGQVQLLGYIHAKDLLDVPRERRAAPLAGDRVRPMVVVSADRSLIDVLRAMRRLRRQLAVVSTPSGPVGVVSVEQIIRALVDA
ncbi:MAG: hemolysin family protein [Acidimicrobiales bacterium]